MLCDLTMWTCFFMLGYALNLWNLAFPINHPTAFTLLHQLVAKPNLHQTKINGLQNCDWRLQDAFIWRFQDATFSVQVFYATLTFTTVTVVLVLPWIMPMKTREIKEVNKKLKSLSAPVVGLILQRSRIVTDNDGHYASSTTYLYPLTDGDTRQGLNNLQATMDSSLTGSGKTFTMQPLPLRATNDLVRQLHRPVYRNQKFKLWLAGFSRGIQEMHRKASLVLEDAVRNIYTVVAFCAGNKVMELYRLQLKKIFKQSFLHGMGIGFAFGFSQFLLFACNALLLWYTAICIRNGYINPSTTLREYMVFSFATFALVEPFGLAPYILKRWKSLISVFDIIDREPKIDPDDNKALKPPNVYGSIELKKVSIFVIHHVMKC
ncbi:hypothetical protein KIW84_030311 [Lathyrus oleraceus]|uniref:ABC transmembrane type-1 domain-containing protein n=1 Tax=Pisum sativum TaxID=3888 RepID=A0A9D4XPC2_PEA|nr:hypothetical protein KIW84_030311 [Pisum sativum]